ncbi:MAG: histidinol dehydrogenase [Actinobacteria bacterium HGW-Actinobacteria-10]|nr:MAG: histidinol dehydrogenase [Actinobacteria bacterium HGW-Actinobacteria-10]
MRRIILERGTRLTAERLARSGGVDAEIIAASARIVDDVKSRGDVAVREYTERFDGVVLSDFRVSSDEIEMAVAQVGDDFLDAISAAAGAIDAFHRRQIPQSWFTTDEAGVFLGQKVTALRRVGIYVPGGRACYPSSVLMNAIPAQVAGVDEIAMVVPPGADGTVDPYTLAAAVEAGVDEIYKIGGAQAVAALAYGTDTIERVDKIVGPGNAYVTAAKKLVMGECGIDMLAGPSEVLVLADESAVPMFVAIDLMAQAEHDPRAATYLVTTNELLPEQVEEALEILLAESPRGDITRRSLQDNGVAIVCPDIVTALDAVDLIAPEHLEVQMTEPFELLGSIRNAGAIFLGPWTPETVGDYVAGPNHVLPTGGTARFSSPLSVDDFVKKSSVISYSYEALQIDGPTAMEIAQREGLWAHAAAVGLRLDALEEFESDFEGESPDDIDREGDA